MIEVEQKKAIQVLEDIYDCKVIYVCPYMKCYYDNGDYTLNCEYRQNAERRRQIVRISEEKQLVRVTCPFHETKCYVIRSLKNKITY